MSWLPDLDFVKNYINVAEPLPLVRFPDLVPTLKYDESTITHCTNPLRDNADFWLSFINSLHTEWRGVHTCMLLISCIVGINHCWRALCSPGVSTGRTHWDLAADTSC